MLLARRRNRKLIEYGKEKDVTLYQCDILDVGKLNRSFDYIECCGVLHHMEDPAKGLTALTALLKTGGKMKLALYSQLARRSVTSARDYIQENGFEPTEADIRACRALLLQQFQTNPAQYPLPAWRDFYSLSECRDLIFHVQEICYNLHELAELIEETGLTFEKFSLPQPVIAAFQSQHPAPEDLANLALWADFEEKNPSTFAGMYQFWVEKKLK